MALNFMGLGFSFGAKDEGLTEKQDQVTAGFDRMTEKMAQMGQAANQADVGGVAPPGSADSITKLAEAVENLSMRLGQDLPEASQEAAENFHRDSSVMESAQRRVGGGFNFIRDSMEKLNTIVRQNKLQTFIQSIQLSVLKDIADGIGNIGTAGRNLTTGLEAEMQQLSVTTRATGANFGFTGKALSAFSGQAAGMAKSLNVDANTAALSLRAWTEAGDELRAMGFKSSAEVAKFSAAFGVNADILRNSGLRMRKEFDMTDEQISQVVGSFTKMGQVTGDVSGALQQMPQMMDLLRRRAAMMGKKLDSKELASYAASTAALAAGFMQMGQSSEQARASAMAISEQMISSKENFNNMFAGTADDIDNMQKSIGIAFGDIGVSFKSMSQGPDEFIAGMATMVQSAKKNGGVTADQMNLIRGQLEAAYGKDKAAELVNFFNKADDATLEMMKTVKNTPAELGKLGKEAHRTGRTLAESFELSKDSFIMNFRAISRKEARAFVKETGKEFRKFNKQLKGIVDEGGPLAGVVKKFSEIHQLGVTALLPKTLRPMAAVMGEILKEATPLVGVMGSLGFRFNMLLSPVFLIAGALAVAIGWFAKLRMEGKSTDEALSIMAKTAKEKFHEAMEFLGRQLEKLKKFLPHVYAFIGGVWDGLIGGVDPDGAGKSKAAEWGEKIGAAMRFAITTAIKFIKNYIKEWWTKMTGIWSDGSKPFTQKIKETIGGSAGIILGAFAIGKFTPVFGILSKMAGLMMPLAKGIGMVGKALFNLIPGPWLIIGGLFALSTLMGKYPEKVNAVLNKIGEYVARLMTFLVGTAIPMAVKGIALVLSKLPGIFWNAFTAAIAAAFQVLDGMKNYLQERFPQWFGVIEAAFFMLKGVAVAVITFIFAKWTIATVAWVKQQLWAAGTYIKTQWKMAKQAVLAAMTTLSKWKAVISQKIALLQLWWLTSGKIWIAAKAKAVWAAVGTAAAWVKTNAIMLGGAIRTAAGMAASALAAAAGWIAAGLAAIVPWLPFIALGAAIGAVFVGAVLLIKKFWGPISGFFKAIWSGIVTGVKWAGTMLKHWLLMPYYIVKAVWWGLTKVFGAIWDAITAAASWVWEKIGHIIMWPIDNIIKPAWEAIKGFFSGIWDGIKAAASWAWDKIKDIVLAPYYAIKAIWNGIKDFFSGLWDGIKSAASWVWDKIKGIVTAPIRWIKSAWSSVTGFFGGIWDSISSAASSAWDAVSGAVGDAWDWITGSSSSNSKSVGQMADEMAKKMETANAKAAAAAAGMSKEVQEKITSNADLAKFQAMKVGEYYQGMTKTSKGEIIKATDSVVRYVQGAHGEVVKIVDAAKNINYGKITGVEQYREAIKLQSEHAARMRDIKRRGLSSGDDEWGEAMKKYRESSQMYRDQYGLALYTIGNQGIAIEKAMSTTKDRIDKLRASDAASAIMFEKQREELLNKVAARALWIEQNKHNMTRAQQDKAYKDLEAMAANYNTQLENSIDLATQSWSQHAFRIMSQGGDMEKTFDQMARQRVNSWRSAQDDILGIVGDGNAQVHDKVKKTLDDLMRAQEYEIQQLKTTTGLSSAAMDSELAKIRQRYDDAATALRTTAQDATLDLSNGITTELDKQITNLETTFQGVIDKGRTATDAMQGEVQKLGFTAEDSKQLLTEIANINTATFKKNLEVVKTEFLNLLSKLGEIQKGLIDLGPTSTKAFEESQKALKAFWADFDKTFASSKNIATIATDVFKKVITAAKDMKSQLKSIFRDIFAEIGDYVKGITDRIRIDSKAMVQELKRTAAAAYQATERAPMEAKALEQGRAPAMKATFKRATIEEGQKQLFEATHWPEWYTRDFAQLAMSMKESLRSMDMKMGAGGETVAAGGARTGGGGFLGALGYQANG